MTEVQEMMLSVCLGAVTGVLIAEFIFIIVTAVKWLKDKIRKRKEKKNTDSKAD